MEDAERINRPGAIFALTWPIFVEMLLQLLIGNVDQLMVGGYSQNAVGAVSNANQLINFLLVLFQVVSTSSTILISQYIGAGNREKANEIYSLAVAVNFVVGVAVSLLLVIGCRTIFIWMNVPAELLEDCCRYARVIGSFLFLPSLYLTFTAFLRSNAMTKVTMAVSFLMNVMNIGLNFLLVFGRLGLPALGVTGAAISSTVSRMIGLIVIFCLFRRAVGVPISVKKLRPFPKDNLKRMLHIGIPTAGESMSYSLSQVCVQSICNLFAVYVITTRVYASFIAQLGYLFSVSLAIATQIVVGHLMGARKIEEVNRRVMTTLRTGTLVSFLFAVLLFLLAEPLFRCFTSDPAILTLGKRVLMVDMVLEIGRAVNMTLVNALQAAGDVRFPIYLSILVVWSVAVGGGYLLGVVAGWGLVGLWAAMAADECSRGVALLIRWRRGAWKTKNLIA